MKDSIRILRSRIGKDNPNWRGGTASITERIRSSMLYEQWRTSVFKRDNYTCQDCGKIGGDLEVHHIKPFRHIIRQYEINKDNLYQIIQTMDLLWDISNGITYCIRCHGLKDKMRRTAL